MKNRTKFQLFLALVLSANLAQAQSLKGSSASIERQYRAALSYGYTFVKSARSVNDYIRPGQLVRVNPDRHMELHDVSYPYARSGTKIFLNRLSAQYSNACGEKLTVTSLLRPRDRQPANSVARSVHPTGMAVDLRVPRKEKCRAWLEKTLLSLEKDRVLDVTRERRPPHYHVALFVKTYETRLAGLSGKSRELVADNGAGQPYVVSRGDTLSEIATRTGVGISQLRAANGLRGNLIYTGQKLQIPASGTLATADIKVASSVVTHRVSRGDTLSKIASRTGVGISQLRAANGLRGNRIYAGQKLQIPATGMLASADETVASVVTHRVNRGDTLWRIANLYGTSVNQLRRANGHSSDALQVGQVLTIYKG